jgi:hypothetical protein
MIGRVMFSTASRYYCYLIFLHHCVISKEVHSPPWLTIINKIIPKQGGGGKDLFPPRAQRREASETMQDRDVS